MSVILKQREVEEQALRLFSFLKGYGFQEPLISRDHFTVLSYLAEGIGIEVELDWQDKFVFVLIVRLEAGQLPNGYYISDSDGQACRMHLQIVLYNLGYRDEEINTEKLYRKRRKKKPQNSSFETMKSALNSNHQLLSRTIGLLISKQKSILWKGQFG